MTPPATPSPVDVIALERAHHEARKGGKDLFRVSAACAFEAPPPRIDWLLLYLMRARMHLDRAEAALIEAQTPTPPTHT